MKAARLTSKLRKMREDHEDEEMENGELNLVPYLDIVTNVIMFLMMTTTFAASLSSINVSSPRVSTAPPGTSTDTPPQQDLNLTLQISEKGYTIAAAGGVLFENDVQGKLPTVPKIGNDYNTAGLTKRMSEIKNNPDIVAEYGEVTKMIINANPDITYETVVAAMDACRNDGDKVLFPDVLLSAGVQ